METKLKISKKNEQLYIPETARITNIEQFTDKEKVFDLELTSGKSLGHVPGQFIQVSILGIGEAPISICSAPSKDNKFQLGVRAVGDVTNKLHTLKVGDLIHFRGPFGHGFDDKIIKKMHHKHVVFIAGGCGFFPLRSLINKTMQEQSKYKKISILYGCKNPSERLFQHELENMPKKGKKVQLLETVDNADDKWSGDKGVITTLIPKLDIVPSETMVAIVGPPIMYKFVLISLMDLNIPKKNIYLSLERRMKCGVGKCGHCQMENVYVCRCGPVFNYAEIEHNREAI